MLRLEPSFLYIYGYHIVRIHTSLLNVDAGVLKLWYCEQKDLATVFFVLGLRRPFSALYSLHSTSLTHPNVHVYHSL